MELYNEESSSLTVLHSFAEQLDRGFAKGVERGLEQGLEQGVDLGVEKTAKKMLQMGLDFEVIMEATGLTLEDMHKIQKQVKG